MPGRIRHRILLSFLTIALFIPSASAGWGKVVSLGSADTIAAAPAISQAAYVLHIPHAQPFLLLLLALAAMYALTRFPLSQHVPIGIITLIVLFPLAAADVTAAYVSPISISGQDGFSLDPNKGFRRMTDVVTVTVDVSLEGEIQNDQVRFVLNSAGPPREGACNGGQCTFISLELTLPGDNFYLVRLYDDIGNLRAQEFMHMYSDSKPPVITLSQNATIIGLGGAIGINWKVRDVRDVETQCGVGIQEIRILRDDFAGEAIETIPGGGLCELNDTLIIQSTGSGEATYKICFEATDRFGNVVRKPQNCITYQEDNDPPQAVVAAVLTTDGKSQLTHLGPNNKSFMVQVNVSGNIIPSTVKFELSSFGLGNMTPTHHKYNETFHSFTLVATANKEESFAASVGVFGNDPAGNQITPAILSLGSIQWDNTGPRFIAIQSSFGSIGNILNVGRSGNITATIADSYLSPAHIHLRFTPEAGSGVSVPADECARVSSNWECIWHFTDLSGEFGEGLYNLTGDNSSRDLFGNLLEDSVTVQAQVDFSPPVVSLIKLEVADAHDFVYGDEIVTDDRLKLTLYVNDSSGSVFAEADFSPIITSMPSGSTASCTPTPDDISDHVCVFPETGPIDRAFPYSLQINISDAMGNTESIYYLLDIIPFLDDPEPDYWDFTSMKCYPDKIDRQVTTLSSQRMYCEFEFTPLGPGIILLSIAMADCQNASETQVSDYIQGFTLLQTQNTSSPWLKIQFRSVKMDIDSLPMLCPFIIYSRLETSEGIYVVQNPESESVPLTINFFNQPLGTLPDNLEEKIKDARDDAENSFLETISMLQTALEFAEMVCNLWSAWNNIRGAFQLMTLKFESTEITASPNPALAEKLRMYKERQCNGTDAVDKYTEKTVKQEQTGFLAICGYVNCKYLPRGDGAESAWGSGYIDKWQEWGYGNLDQIPGAEHLPGSLAEKEQMASALNAKENLLLSLLTGCIPGIIIGIEKYRQVLCMYSYCLNRSADYGGDAAACKEMKEYAMCMFVFGEIVYALPWTALWAHWLDRLSQVLSNPFAMIGTVFSVACKESCPVPKTGGSIFTACRLFYATSMVSSALAEILNAWQKEEYTSEVDWCQLMDDDSEGSLFGFL